MKNFNPNESSLYANKSFVEQANIIIDWKENHLNPNTLFCLTSNATAAEIRTRYRQLCLHFHGDKNPGYEQIASKAVTILAEARDYLLYQLQNTHSSEAEKEMKSNLFYKVLPINRQPHSNGKFNTASGLFKGATVMAVYPYSADNRFESIDLCLQSYNASHYYDSKLKYCYNYFNVNSALINTSFFSGIPEQIKIDIRLNPALLTENLLGPGREKMFNIVHLAATSSNADLFSWLLNQGADLSIKALNKWSVLDLAIATQRTEIIQVLKNRLGQAAIERGYQTFLEEKIIYPQRPSPSTSSYGSWLGSHRDTLVSAFIHEKRQNQNRVAFILEKMPHWSNNLIFLKKCLSRNPALLGFVSSFACIGEDGELGFIQQQVQSVGEYYRFVSDKYRLDHSVIALAFSQSRISSNALPLFPPDSRPSFRANTQIEKEKSFLRTGKLSIYFLCALEQLWPDLNLEREEKADSRYNYRRAALLIEPFYSYYLPCVSLLALLLLLHAGTFFWLSIQAHLVLSLVCTLASYDFLSVRSDDDFTGINFKNKMIYFHLYMSPIYCLLAYGLTGVGLSLYCALTLGNVLAINLITCINLFRIQQEAQAIQNIITEHTPKVHSTTSGFFNSFFQNCGIKQAKTSTSEADEAALFMETAPSSVVL